ncbi:MAG TPA: NFACT RNA binding domain-containing protein [Planctomycetota bacterium]|nr:NFACT RNA binding domain-containing protein [Planctomycetota bacterium]
MAIAAAPSFGHSEPGPAPRGLSAAELAAAVAELQSLVGATVLDVVPLSAPPGDDDLLLVLHPREEAGHRVFLHLAPGGPRARVTTTARRFGKPDFARGPARDLLHQELAGATLQHVTQPPGERRCAFDFRTERGDRRLVVELFGARGLWALLHADGKLLLLSRPVETAVRTLHKGDGYAAPPAAGEPRADTENRFAPPVLPAIDAHFTQLDLRAAATHEHELLQRSAQRALQKAQARAQGIGQQLADTGRSQALRAEADLMLAYAHAVPRGAAHMVVPDPDHDGEERTIELDPSKPVVAQANARYEKARRLDDGREIAERRHAEATASVTVLEQVLADLAAIPADAAEPLARVRSTLEALGALPRRKPPAAAKARARPADAEARFRRFVSAEGYTILVGRNNQQNDELTMRTANGNDLWLHVGGGRAGSHVVVRLPKQKTASLETLLDAGTLAVHFSKARGESRIDVIYTHRKHVRKPKGLPAGAVVPSQTRTVTVQFDAARLQRLLDSAGGDDE